MTGLLLDTELSADQRDCLETIRSAGDALLSIVSDVLDFSKIEANRLEIAAQPLDLRACIESSLDLVAAEAARKGLDLAYEVQPGTPDRVLGDAARLRQVLVNLLSNAVKFTDRGEVAVAVEAQAYEPGRFMVDFRVRDTGIGIAANRMDRLFQPFSQVDASATRNHGGTGLGLAISRRLTELMGGTMWAASTPGQGSTFHFRIRAESVAEGPSAGLAGPQPHLTGRHLLVVDDNANNRRILVRLAQSWGMDVAAYATGREALAAIDAGAAFDVAILDMQMPEMDGATLAREIRRRAASAALPLILLTSVGTYGLDGGTDFAAHLTKPVKFYQLYMALLDAVAGEGTTVAERPVRPVVESDLAARHPLAILVVEDNAVNQKVALKILERLGYRADMAASGAEALAALTERRYDVVLMDVEMPQMDGIETTRRIRANPSIRPQPRIVALTAYALEADRARCLAAGMDDYVAKPVQVGDVAAVLKRCGSVARAGGVVDSGGRSSNRPDHEIDSTTPSAAGAAVRRRLSDVVGGGEGADDKAVDALVALFIDDARRHLATLRAAIQAGDSAAAGRALHGLKGCGRNVGAAGFADLCEAGERRLAAEGLTGITGESGALERDLEALVASIRSA